MEVNGEEWNARYILKFIGAKFIGTQGRKAPFNCYEDKS